MGIGSFSLPIVSQPLNQNVLPPDWASISNVPNNEIYLLTCDAGMCPFGFVVTTSAGTYNVDWGDGNSTTGITSGTRAEYTYVTGSGLTGTTTPNMTTFRCRIYATSGTITRFFIQRSTYYTTAGTYQIYPILAANFGTTGLTSFANAFYESSTAGSADLLKTVFFPSSMNACTTMANAFNSNRDLESVELPTSMTGVTSFSATFATTRSLKYVRMPLVYGTSFDMSSTFQSSAINQVDFPTNMDFCNNMGSCFQSTPNLMSVKFPNSMLGCTSFVNTFNGSNIKNITLPSFLSQSSSINFQSFCVNSPNIENITFPAGANRIGTMTQAFANCVALQTVVFEPSVMNDLNNLNSLFNGCSTLRYVKFPSSAPNINTAQAMFGGCQSLGNLTLPNLNNGGLTNIQGWFQSATSLRNVTNIANLGSTTSPVNGSNLCNSTLSLESFSTNTQWSKLDIFGGAAAKTKVSSIRLFNAAAGQYTGTSPQLNLVHNNLSQAALVQIFNDLPTVVGRTIAITGNPGTALLTPAEDAIATGKGWSITK